MTLDNNDKKIIKKIVKDALAEQSKGTPKRSKDVKLQQPKKETAEVDTATRLNEIRSTVAKNKTVKSLVGSLAYSNPITALLYEQWDLISGVQKALAKSTKLTKSGVEKTTNAIATLRSSDTTAMNSMVPTNTNKLRVDNGTNYIAAKQALFVGGKNYINISAPLTPFNVNDREVPPMVGGKQPKLIAPRPDKNIIEMKKGIDGIFKNAKTSNLLLTSINKRAVATTGLVLLGIAAIAGLVNWIKNKLPSDFIASPKEMLNKSEGAIAKTLGNQMINPKSEAEYATKGGFGKVESMKYSPKGMFQLSPKATITTSEGKSTPVIAPYDGEITVSDVFGEKWIMLGHFYKDNKKRNFTLKDVVKPKIGRGKFKKGEILAYSESSFIFEGEWTKDEMDDIQKYYEEQAQSNYADTAKMLSETPQETLDERRKYFDNMGKVNNVLNAATDKWMTPKESVEYIVDGVKDKWQQTKDAYAKKYRDNNTPLSKMDLGVKPIEYEEVMQNMNATFSDVNKANKNEQLAKDNIVKTNTKASKTPKDNPNTQTPSTVVIPGSRGQGTSVSFQPSSALDISLMLNSPLTVKGC